MENERNLEEDESITASIDDSYAEDNSDDEYISIDDIEEIRDGRYVHPKINARDARLKIYDRIRQ